MPFGWIEFDLTVKDCICQFWCTVSLNITSSFTCLLASLKIFCLFHDMSIFSTSLKAEKDSGAFRVPCTVPLPLCSVLPATALPLAASSKRSKNKSATLHQLLLWSLQKHIWNLTLVMVFKQQWMTYPADKCTPLDFTLTLGPGKDKQNNPKDAHAVAGTWSHLVRTEISQEWNLNESPGDSGTELTLITLKSRGNWQQRPLKWL